MLFYELIHRTAKVATLSAAVALGFTISQQAMAEQSGDNPFTRQASLETLFASNGERCGAGKCGAGKCGAAMDVMDVKRSEVSYTIPEVKLVNQNGNNVTLSELLDTDQPVMMNFIFTTCTAICPAMSATFAGVQKKLGNDSEKIKMISVSIDPEYDKPDTLKSYAKRFKAGPQWEFLTGSQDDSISVQKAFDADRGDKMNHAPLTLMRASRNSKWVRYEGFASADDLAKEARSML